MSTRKGPGTPKNEALVALAKAVGDHYRATGDDCFTIQLYPSADTIAVVAYYGPADRLTVLVPMTDAGWNVYVETQLAHEFSVVCGERIRQEKFCEQFITGKVLGVVHAYR